MTVTSHAGFPSPQTRPLRGPCPALSPLCFGFVWVCFLAAVLCFQHSNGFVPPKSSACRVSAPSWPVPREYRCDPRVLSFQVFQFRPACLPAPDRPSPPRGFVPAFHQSTSFVFKQIRGFVFKKFSVFSRQFSVSAPGLPTYAFRASAVCRPPTAYCGQRAGLPAQSPQFSDREKWVEPIFPEKRPFSVLISFRIITLNPCSLIRLKVTHPIEKRRLSSAQFVPPQILTPSGTWAVSLGMGIPSVRHSRESGNPVRR